MHKEENKMKLLIVGVNGRVGSLVAKDALSRNLEVTGLGKGENSLHLQNYVQKDALELPKEEVDRRNDSEYY